MSGTYRSAWNESYDRNQNALFWPNEHLVRFVATRLRRRLTLDSFEDLTALDRDAKVLDLGCGMGRHLAYLVEMGFVPSGIDLSDRAVAHAVEWMSRLGLDNLSIVTGSVETLPWKSGTFDAAVSHAVLDSMPYRVAESAVKEVRRVVKPGGWVYVDLIAGDTASETLVTGAHEKGTIQSFFDFAKVERLLSPFKIDECYLARCEPIIGGRESARWHVICR